MQRQLNYSILLRIIQVVFSVSIFGTSVYVLISSSIGHEIKPESAVVIATSGLTLIYLVLSFFIYRFMPVVVAFSLELGVLIISAVGLVVECYYNAGTVCSVTIRSVFYSYVNTDKYCVLAKVLIVFLVIVAFLFMISTILIGVCGLRATKLRYATVMKKNLGPGSLVSLIEPDYNIDYYDTKTTTTGTLTTRDYYSQRDSSLLKPSSNYAYTIHTQQPSFNSENTINSYPRPLSNYGHERMSSNYSHTIYTQQPEPNITMYSSVPNTPRRDNHSSYHR